MPKKGAGNAFWDVDPYFCLMLLLWVSLTLIQTGCKPTTLLLWKQKVHFLLHGSEWSLVAFTDFGIWCSSYGTGRDFLVVVQHCRQRRLAISSRKWLNFTWKSVSWVLLETTFTFPVPQWLQISCFSRLCLLAAILCPFALIPMSSFTLKAFLSAGELDAPFLQCDYWK